MQTETKAYVHYRETLRKETGSPAKIFYRQRLDREQNWLKITKKLDWSLIYRSHICGILASIA